MWIHTPQRIYRNNRIHLTDMPLERRLITNIFEIWERRNPALQNGSSTLSELFWKRDTSDLAQCPWLSASERCITLFTQFCLKCPKNHSGSLILENFPKIQQEAWLANTVNYSQPLLPTALHPCISTKHILKIHETTTPPPNPLYWTYRHFSCLHFQNNPV